MTQSNHHLMEMSVLIGRMIKNACLGLLLVALALFMGMAGEVSWVQGAGTETVLIFSGTNVASHIFPQVLALDCPGPL